MQAALLDEALPRPAALEAHLASCAECRAVAAAHRSALRLSGEAPVLPARRPLAEVRRRAGVVVGLTIAFAGAVGWWQLEKTPAPRPALVEQVAAPRPEPEGVQVVADDDEVPEQALVALAALQLDAEVTVHRDARIDALDVRFFGALPVWTAPTRTRPLRPLGKLASPIVLTQEDSP
jgi:hypothetical protein